MCREILDFFGSLKLAVVLLAIITGVLAFATFYESAHTTQAVMRQVYRTWWFNGLLAVLALNIASAALTRWPWRKKHVGFVITHLGLIVLLGGCSAAFHYGTEGMMELHIGNQPSSLVRLEDEALTIVQPEAGVRIREVLAHGRGGSIRPRTIQVTREFALSIDQYVPNSTVETIVQEGGDQPNPAVRFRLQSDLVKQDVSQWLLANSPEDSRASIVPAKVAFVMAASEDELRRLTTQPDNTQTAGPELLITLSGKQFKLGVADNQGRSISLGDVGISAKVTGYWPDFRLDETTHQPTSVSDQPNNPAAMVVLARGDSEERQFVFGNGQMEPIVRSIRGEPIGATVQLQAVAAAQGGGGLQVILAPDGKLWFAAAAKQGFKSGELRVGEPVETGWMDFKFTVQQFVPKAIVAQRITAIPADPAGNFPAVAVSAQSGAEKQTAWVRFGEPAVIQVGGKSLHLLYGWGTMELPFTVALEEFIVEHDEGSDNVAGWTSKVIFEDGARGVNRRASIWMNHPASFGEYKLAQASWNPNDLNYTALQVKRDPPFVSWLIWSGAVLIVSGAAMLFYFRRWFSEKNEGEGRRDEDGRGKGEQGMTKEAMVI